MNKLCNINLYSMNNLAEVPERAASEHEKKKVRDLA
jgi:hypothetical protein